MVSPDEGVQNGNSPREAVTVFHWPVCAKGYEIAKQRPFVNRDPRSTKLPIATDWLTDSILQNDRISVLIEKEKIEEGVHVGTLPNKGQLRYYEPLSEEPGLFRRFSELPVDNPESWVEFANRYGLLGNTVCVAKTDDEHPKREAELLDEWAYQVWLMKSIVRLWSLWRDEQNEGELRKLVKQNPQVNRYWTYSNPLGPFPGVRYLGKKYRRDLKWYFPAQKTCEFTDDCNNSRKAAALLLLSEVNDQLSEHASPALVYDIATRRPVLRLRPTTLLGALWLQFAQAINEDDALHPCASCGKWFVVNNAKDARRKRKRFCSALCKLHDHRRRQADALQFANDGIRPIEIAKRTGTPLVTVKNWIQQARTQKKS